MASVTVTIPNSPWRTVNARDLQWHPSGGSYVSLGDSLSADGNEIWLSFLQMRYTGAGSGNVSLQLSSSATETPSFAGDDFSDVMETSGTIKFTASDGSMLTLTGIGDSTEPYAWTPSNAADVAAFANIVRALSDRSMTVTFNDNAGVAPTFTDDTGDAQDWTIGDNVVLVVPAASGDPAPTYAVEGALPDGLSFDAASRTISGMPTTAGTGTITVRATNSQGSDDWTVGYAITTGTPSVTAGMYRLLVDTNGDGSFGTDIFSNIAALRAEHGASGAQRNRTIHFKAGVLTATILNSRDTYEPSDFEDNGIRWYRGNVPLWAGTIDDVEDIKLRGRRAIRISALGQKTDLRGNVEDNIITSGDTNVTDLMEMLTGLANLPDRTEVLEDWQVAAGSQILDGITQIEVSAGVRLYEEPGGGFGLVGQAIDGTLDLTIAETPVAVEFPSPYERPTRRFKALTPKGTVINTTIIDGTKRSDVESVNEHGEQLHPNTFPFVRGTDAARLSDDIFDIYSRIPTIYDVSLELSQLLGDDPVQARDILKRLHYGNDALVKVRDGNTLKPTEILNVKHNLGRGLKHIVSLMLRERRVNELSLEITDTATVDVGYFLTLPPFDTSGNAITGHKIEFRETGTTAWMEHVSTDTGLVVESTFTVPSAGAYEVRAIATNSGGDQQTSPAQEFVIAQDAIAHSQTLAILSGRYRSYRITRGNSNVIGYDFEGEWNDVFDNSPRSFSRSNQAVDAQGRLLLDGPFANPDIVWPYISNTYGDTDLRFRWRQIYNTPGETIANSRRSIWLPWLSHRDIMTVDATIPTS